VASLRGRPITRKRISPQNQIRHSGGAARQCSQVFQSGAYFQVSTWSIVVIKIGDEKDYFAITHGELTDRHGRSD
jgi:hypothetical protein